MSCVVKDHIFCIRKDILNEGLPFQRELSALQKLISQFLFSWRLSEAREIIRCLCSLYVAAKIGALCRILKKLIVATTVLAFSYEALTMHNCRLADRRVAGLRGRRGHSCSPAHSRYPSLSQLFLTSLNL